MENSFSTSPRHEPLHGTLLGSVRRLSELVVLLVIVVVAVRVVVVQVVLVLVLVLVVVVLVGVIKLLI